MCVSSATAPRRSMADTYYRDLSSRHDAAQRVGWRSRLEQAYRFEMVLEYLRACGGTRVLDVGCGDGALSRYARDRGVQLQIVGIEPYEPLAKIASSHHQVLRCTYEECGDTQLQADAAIGIGVHAGRRTLTQLQSLVDFVRAVAPNWCLSLLDAHAIAARPAIALEHGSAALTPDDVVGRFGESTARITTLDWLVWGPGCAPNFETADSRLDSVIAGPWGIAATMAERAWLAAEVGLYQRAEAFLRSASPQERHLIEVVEGRLALLSSGDSG